MVQPGGYSPPAPTRAPAAGVVPLVLGLVVAFVMPVAYLVVPILAGNFGRNTDGLTAAVVLLALVGGALWIGALVAAIRSLAQSRRTGRSQALGWGSLLLCLVALVTGAIGWFFGLIFGAGGGPH
ncbi:MAG TPA: hypothetical protein VMI75_03000 [Polyangiaceae bacterium]|nr:hypothetical protein [Polyangiaceae bacterium]